MQKSHICLSLHLDYVACLVCFIICFSHLNVEVIIVDHIFLLIFYMTREFK